jgi:hypothetical protein
MCNCSNQSQATTTSWWKDPAATTALSTLAGVIIGAALTIGANYWITYKGIEEPKIELEKTKTAIESKKASIEAHKQALSLTPTVSTSCNSYPIDAWTLRVSCNSKNTGTYHAFVKISDVVLSVNTDTNETKYARGNGFTVAYPNNKDMFLLSPASDGDLWFYVKFDSQKYTSGVNAATLVSRVSVSYSTIDEAKNFVVAQFPELKDIVARVASRNTEIFVYSTK